MGTSNVWSFEPCVDWLITFKIHGKIPFGIIGRFVGKVSVAFPAFQLFLKKTFFIREHHIAVFNDCGKEFWSEIIIRHVTLPAFDAFDAW